MKATLKLYLLLLCSSILLPACSEVPITGRAQFNLMPDSVMNSMSFQSYQEFIGKNKLSSNAQQTQMVKRVGVRIQEAVERYCEENYLYERLEGYHWEFNLVEDPNINAWAMPGGKVVVYTGLLPLAQNDAGLAVVMGHEIAHAFARHGSERMTLGFATQFGTIAISTALKDHPTATRNLFLRSYGLGAQIGLLLPYSRKHETEADHLGLVFMAMAGYQPENAVTFWQRMADKKKGSQQIPELLSTHPADATRIQNIKELIPEAMQYFRPQ